MSYPAWVHDAIHACDARRWPCDNPDLLPTLCGREVSRLIVYRQPNPSDLRFCEDCREVMNERLADAEEGS